MRGGPRGEARIFETPEELNELSRGASPKYMNGQFRYYLAGVAMMQPQGDCKAPLLAVNVCGREPARHADGRRSTASSRSPRSSAATARRLTETVGVAVPRRHPRPVLEQAGRRRSTRSRTSSRPTPSRDPDRWAKIAAINPQRLKVWFKPEAFYYADGTQYAQRTGKVAAQRDVLTCGGLEGARSLIK